MRANVPPRPAGAEEAVGAVPRQHLVQKPLSLRHLLLEHVGREQAFEQVVIAGVALPPGEPDHSRGGVALEHRADGVLRQPEPVLRRAGRHLEVERRHRSLDTDPLEHLSGHRRVVGERRVVEPGPLAAHDVAKPGELRRRDERERLVAGLEDLAPLVELVAPGGLVAGYARVEHQVVVPARDRDRVELDRAELPDHLEHRVGASFQRARGRQEVPRDEEAAGRLGADLHR